MPNMVRNSCEKRKNNKTKTKQKDSFKMCFDYFEAIIYDADTESSEQFRTKSKQNAASAKRGKTNVASHPWSFTFNSRRMKLWQH